MRKLKKLEYSDFEQDKTFTRHFAWLPNVYLHDDLKEVDIKFDHQLLVLSESNQSKAKKIIEEYVQKKFKLQSQLLLLIKKQQNTLMVQLRVKREIKQVKWYPQLKMKV